MLISPCCAYHTQHTPNRVVDLRTGTAGQSDTVLLTVDVAKLPAGALKWEPVEHRSDLLPHLFAALPLAAVTQEVLMELDSDGAPIMPAEFYTPPPLPIPKAADGAGVGSTYRQSLPRC